MHVSDYEQLFSEGSKSQGVFAVLRDQQWHCRECEYRHINITQIAGGGGIQGLERGTGSRPGIVIESANHFCGDCEKTTRQDKWTGQFVSAVQMAGMTSAFVRRAATLLGRRDVVEKTERPVNQLTLDHKLPMLRWDEDAKQSQTGYTNMTDDDIRETFQLLKKTNGSVSHNSLKSRACEKCFKQGKRGKPFGIDFYYEGDSLWRGKDKKDPNGCVGCGWFDFAKWRSALNLKLAKPT